NVKQWLQEIDRCAASEGVNKLLVWNKCNPQVSRRQAYSIFNRIFQSAPGIPFSETSILNATDVEQTFLTM
ncbi:hypothetical protein K503DRAFT_648065, partial [Rhizopogon vinicolor AM-OR11-026]